MRHARHGVRQAAARRTTVAVGSAVTALLLSACGTQNAPGVAADVAGDQITDSQVDDFAQVLCKLGSGSGGTAAGAPTKQLRFQSLQILMGNDLAKDVIDPATVDEQQVAAAKDQAATTRNGLPSSLRGVFDQVVTDYASAQLGLTELGRRSLERSGKKNVDDQTAFAEGDRLRAAYATKADISVDPRFGTFTGGTLKPADGSLSVPVSQEAVDAEQPDAPGTDLPANLTCR